MFGLLAVSLVGAADRRVMMPGPLAAAHGSQAKCETCHADAGREKFSWWPQVFLGTDPHADGKACLTCHKIERAAFEPHGVAGEQLKQRTAARQNSDASTARPLLANLRDYLFSTRTSRSGAVFCATCHDEHQGREADITKVADARCQACHVVQFDDFSRGHPPYSKYPFRRRTRIQFDHAQHFAKNFPDAIERNRNVGEAPSRCMDCHVPSGSSGHMALKPFSQTCASCHERQLLGHERTSGPKGVALLSLPGLDLEALRKAGLSIGNWPRDAEAEVSPLMALLIGIDDRRRDVVAQVQRLNLLDLEGASQAELRAVATFAWEVKLLLRDLLTSPKTRFAERVEKSTSAAIERGLAARLIAALPRDVLAGFQRQWLPDLSAEVDAYVDRGGKPVADKGKLKGSKKPARSSAGSKPNSAKPKRKSVVRTRNKPSSGLWRINPRGELVKGAQKAAPPAKQVDEGTSQAEPEKPSGLPDRDQDPPAATPPGDSEAWAAFGGWYRNDFAVYYRPTGHDDPFLTAWLNLTGSVQGRSKAVAEIAAPAFDYLAAKDAVGQCTKCHSVDDMAQGGRRINWSPRPAAANAGRFTRFSHAPHFGVVGEQGCLTCHKLAETGPTKAAYKGGNPLTFTSNFKSIEKKTCDGCHNRTAARQDCTLCHTYHITKVESPPLTTRLPGK